MYVMERVMKRIALLKSSRRLPTLVDTLNECITEFEEEEEEEEEEDREDEEQEEIDDVCSVITLIDDEDWACEVEFDEYPFGTEEFHKKLGTAMNNAELQRTFEKRKEMAVLMQEMLYRNASLMKKQFTFAFDAMGQWKPLKTQSQYYDDFVAAYNLPKGSKTVKTLRDIAGLWHKMLCLNKGFRRPCEFSFGTTAKGNEIYAKDWQLVTIKK